MKYWTCVFVMTLVVASAMFGCGHEMTNDQIIYEIKKCNDSGLDAKIIYYNDGTVARVICLPKGEK